MKFAYKKHYRLEVDGGDGQIWYEIYVVWALVFIEPSILNNIYYFRKTKRANRRYTIQVGDFHVSPFAIWTLNEIREIYYG